MAAPGVYLKVPQRAPAAGPIPIRVAMVADMSTYYANNGIIDNALEVVLVRRDAPGVRLLAKIDPHAIMLPDAPLPPPTSKRDLEGAVAEERTLDLLDYGAQHPGAAAYHVFAAFSRWVSDPQPLVVEHTARHPGAPARPLPDDVPRPPIRTAPHSLALELRVVKGHGGPFFEGGARWALQPGNDAPPINHLTLVIAQLAPQGGVSTFCCELDPQLDAGTWAAVFSIPVTKFEPAPKPGPARLLAFCGTHYSRTGDVVLP